MAIDLENPATAGDEIAATTHALAAQLAHHAIETVEDCERAVRDRQEIAAASGRVREFFEPLKRSAYGLWKTLCARESEVLAPLNALDARTRESLAEFKRAQDRIRVAAEREEQQQRQREREAQALETAGDYSRQGDHALAEAVLAEAATAPAPVVALRDVTKDVPDLKFRREWRWRLVNADLIPIEFRSVDEKRINAYVRAMKGSARIPGVEVYYDDLPVR